MPNNPIPLKKKIIRDPFTERLLTIWHQLVKKDAIGKKKDFCDAILVKNNFLNEIELSESNYPQDLEKRHQVGMNLLHKYGVNPDYLHGLSDRQFEREPEKAKKPMGNRAAALDFRDKRQKQELLASLEAKEARIIELEELLAQVAEAKSTYNPDKKTDKK